MKPRLQQKQIIKVKLSVRTRLIYATAGVAIITIITGIAVFLYGNLGTSEKARASVSGDYRTLMSGNWNNATTWQKYNGTLWVATLSPPSSGDGVIEIQSGHTVTLTADVTADQIIVDAGGTLNINSSRYLYTANGTGNDLQVDGTVNILSSGYITQNNSSAVVVNGTISLGNGATHTVKSGSTLTINSGGKFRQDGGTFSNAGTFTVSSGGTYQHNMNSGTIPTATWSTGSTCEVTGTTNTKPNGLSQSFYNFTWNATSQSAALDFNANLTTVNGSLTLISTGNSHIQFDKQGNNSTLNVGKNVYVQGGTTYCCANGDIIINIAGDYVQTGGNFIINKAGATAYGNTSLEMFVAGDVTISGGTMDLSQYDGNNFDKGMGHLILSGDITLSASGLLTETSINAHGGVFFAGTGVQQYAYIPSANISQKIDFIVNSGAILRMDNRTIPGIGNFSVLDGGGLMIGSADGITSSGAIGNIQVTGARSYSTAGDYTYNGTVSQVSGNGLPSTVHNLTLDNTNGLTLTNTVAVSNLFNLTNGIVKTGNYEVYVTNNLTTAITGYALANYVNGYLRRMISSTGTYDFPVGTSSQYELASLKINSITVTKNFLVNFNHPHTGTTPNPGTCIVNGSSIVGLLDYGYWTITPDVAFGSGTFDITLKERGYTNGGTSPNAYAVVTRLNTASAWYSSGTHNNNTQSESGGTVTAVRTVVPVTGNFAIGFSTYFMPISLVYFEALVESNSTVQLTWETETEHNNHFFMVQRSADGNTWENIDTVAAVGNSVAPQDYKTYDSHPIKGESYYRLKQCDYGLTYLYSNAVAVKLSDDNTMLSGDFNVYPNPTRGLINISIHEITDETMIRVFDIKGSLVKEIKPSKESDAQIDLSGKSPGVYIVKVGNGGVSDGSKRVVLNR